MGTVEAAAEAMGADVEVLKKTLEDYNEVGRGSWSSRQPPILLGRLLGWGKMEITAWWFHVASHVFSNCSYLEIIF